MQRSIDLGESGPAVRECAILRLALIVVGLFWMVLTIGFATGSRWITWMWPWPDADMTYIFVASIAAAVAFPLFWIALIEEPPAIAGLAIDGACIGIGLTAALIVFWLNGRGFSAMYWMVPSLSIIVMIWLFRRYHPAPLRDAQPMPRPLRILFSLFIALLWVIASLLWFRVENVFPWDLLPRTSSLIGAMFFGASASFAYALYRNRWVMAGGALLGFLAYDIVLAIPYVRIIRQLGDDAGSGSPVYGSYAAPGEGSDLNGTSLTIYLITISISSAVAIYYLFIRRETSIWPHLQGALGKN